MARHIVFLRDFDWYAFGHPRWHRAYRAGAQVFAPGALAEIVLQTGAARVMTPDEIAAFRALHRKQV